MICVQGTGLSGFAFPTCIVRVDCSVILPSLEASSIFGWINDPVCLKRSYLVDFVVYAIVRGMGDISFLLDEVPYYDEGFLLSTEKAGFSTLAVYRDAGLLMSESLFDNISALLGHRMAGTSYDDDYNSFVSSGWYELVSLDGVSSLAGKDIERPSLFACSLYALMRETKLGSRFLKLNTDCFRNIFGR